MAPSIPQARKLVVLKQLPMHFLHLTLLTCIVFSAGPAADYPRTSPVKDFKSGTARPVSGAANIMFQSTDGGKTWEDVSNSLPEDEQPEAFFAGPSALYFRVNDVLYRSKSNLQQPVWEKEKDFDVQSPSIAFNRSGVMAYTYDGRVYQKMSATSNWQPVYTSFQKHLLRTVFESADGSIFIGSDFGLYKSADRGKTWKQVQNQGWVMDIVEADGVLIATGQGGILRSADHGEHWEWVISEGGVGIAVERIEGGFAAIFYSSQTKSRRIHMSLDGGKTWKAIDHGLRPAFSTSSIKQVGKYLICGHPDGIFRSSDMGTTWQMVHSGVPEIPSVKPWMLTPGVVNNQIQDNSKVFQIYQSGQTLYAVVKAGGC